MPHTPKFDPVLRLADVRAPREELEAALGVAFSRYEPARSGQGAYAQINFSEEADWSDVESKLRRIGPALKLAFERADCGRPQLDVAFYVPAESFGRSLSIPTGVSEALGRFGIELELSIYLFSELDSE